jgi:F-type H+-transporting ATPase subunit a
MNGPNLDLTLYTAPTPAEQPLVFTVTPDVVAGIGGYRVDWVLNGIKGWTMAHPEESIPESIAHDIEEGIAHKYLAPLLKELNIGVDALDALRQFTGPYNQDSLRLLGRVGESFAHCGRGSPYLQEIVAKIPEIPSPLDQFSILPLIPMKIGNFYFSFTNSSLFMLLTLSLVLLLIHFVTKKGGGNLVPNAWQSLVELIYDFVLNLVNEQIGGLSGNVKQKFFPCILVTFTFLLFCNLQGMIPYSFTVTSHFLITLGLSFSIFIGITIVGFQRNGLHFLSFLLPAGVPLPLAPFLVLLELISYCFRALSLGIRLFANMMAGHSLVKILSGFAWTMLCMNDILYFIGDLGPLFIVLALTGLELGVAILQAYVFTILICIYLNDAINLH